MGPPCARGFIVRDIELLAAYDRACQRTFKDQDRDESGQFAAVDNIQDGESAPKAPTGTSRQAGLRRLEKAAAADPKARDLDDAAAYMLLATSNAQGELSALERGLHALRSGMDVRAYAKACGRKENTVGNGAKAARVAETVTDIGDEVSRHFSQLVEIHAAPPWLWPSLVRAMLDKGWTAEVATQVATCHLARARREAPRHGYP